LKTYLVGGAVRDELLGLPVKERDWVVVNAAPESMLQAGFLPVGKSFPVFLHPETKEEYALARLERKVAGGYAGFVFDTSPSVTLEEDLSRRDLTINAMAKTTDGKIIDPFNGQADLKNRILRHVSVAFVEDPVRVLRVARFMARFAPLGFRVAPETLALMRKMGENGELDYLVPERVWKELAQALSEASPVAFIQTLRACGALQRLLPEIDNLYGVPQSPASHPEIDTGIHNELVLQQATQLSNDPRVRFAALLHDVGKGLTPKNLWPKHPGHEHKGVALVTQLCQRLRVPNDFQALAELATRMHGECYEIPGKSADAILSLLEQGDAFRRPERFISFLLVCEADFRGRPGYDMAKHPSLPILKSALTAAQALDLDAVIKNSDQTGEGIKAAVRAARLQAITMALKIP